jgi:GNAT superfamily N-acetyltransferase
MLFYAMEFQIEDITIKPLTPAVWDDFVTLFGDRGASGGCWCMWWRQSRKEYESNKGNRNKQHMKALVGSGETPGLLAYCEGVPCGWCAVSPREGLFRLEKSRVLKRIDEQPVWSIVCFYIDRKYRGSGLGAKLVLGATEFVKSKGGKIIEAYPSVIKAGRTASSDIYTGLPQIFEQAGFKKVFQPSQTKLVMRYCFD